MPLNSGRDQPLIGMSGVLDLQCRLLALCPSGDRQRQVHPNLVRPGRFDHRVAEPVAPLLTCVGTAGEPLRTNFDHDVQPAGIVGASWVKSNVHVTRLKHAVVRLFRTFDCEGDGVRESLGEGLQPGRRNLRVVGDLDDGHGLTLVPHKDGRFRTPSRSGRSGRGIADVWARARHAAVSPVTYDRFFALRNVRG